MGVALGAPHTSGGVSPRGSVEKRSAGGGQAERRQDMQGSRCGGPPSIVPAASGLWLVKWGTRAGNNRERKRQDKALQPQIQQKGSAAVSHSRNHHRVSPPENKVSSSKARTCAKHKKRGGGGGGGRSRATKPPRKHNGAVLTSICMAGRWGAARVVVSTCVSSASQEDGSPARRSE